MRQHHHTKSLGGFTTSLKHKGYDMIRFFQADSIGLGRTDENAWPVGFGLKFRPAKKNRLKIRASQSNIGSPKNH